MPILLYKCLFKTPPVLIIAVLSSYLSETPWVYTRISITQLFC